MGYSNWDRIFVFLLGLFKRIKLVEDTSTISQDTDNAKSLDEDNVVLDPSEKDSKKTFNEEGLQLNVEEFVFEKDRPNLSTDEITKKLRDVIKPGFGHTETSGVALQCVEYVQYRVWAKLGIKIDWTGRVGPRHGGKWPEQFIRLQRYCLLDKPKKWCAMSFANPDFNKPYGHVAFVEEVKSGDSVIISEANWTKKVDGRYSMRTLSKEEWSQPKWGAKFISFKD